MYIYRDDDDTKTFGCISAGDLSIPARSQRVDAVRLKWPCQPEKGIFF